MHSFDTYKFIKIIKNAGLTEEQAEAIVNTVAESREYDFSKLATTEQLHAIEEKILSVTATKEDLYKLEEKLTTQIHSVEVSLLKWIIPLLITIIGMFGTIVFKLFVA